MFNVSTLLLDDAFKPATSLTNGVICETLRQFAPLSDISQGSVATYYCKFAPDSDYETISKIG